MKEHEQEYGLIHKSLPPYEVLYTKWLPYKDVLKLKRIEEMVEVYYNSGQFTYTLSQLVKAFATPFAMYEAMGAYYEENGLHVVSHSRVSRYEILLQFALQKDAKRGELYRELLVFDLYLRENMKNRPEFAGEYTMEKEELSAFYEKESKEHCYLEGYEMYDKRQLRKMTHMERFHYDVTEDGTRRERVILFDYRNRNPLNYQARIFCMTDLEFL